MALVSCRMRPLSKRRSRIDGVKSFIFVSFRLKISQDAGNESRAHKSAGPLGWETSNTGANANGAGRPLTRQRAPLDRRQT